MAIIVAEKVLRNTLDMLTKHIYDDIVTHEALLTIEQDTEDVDSGFSVVVNTAGGDGNARDVTITTVANVSDSLVSKYFRHGTPSANYNIWLLSSSTSQSTLDTIENNYPNQTNIFVCLSASDLTDAEVATEVGTVLANEPNLTVTVATNTIRIVNKEVDQRQKTILFQYFGYNKFDEIDYFDTLRKMIKNKFTDGKQKKLTVRMGFDFNEREMPHLNLILPNEEATPLQVGTTGQMFKYADGTYAYGNFQGSSVMYNLVISSKNMNEVVPLYYFYKTLIISAVEQFELRGLKNMKVSGRDLTVDFELAPLQFSHRALGLDFYYETCVPDFNKLVKANTLNLTGTIIEES